jgi:hypothetical protein
MSAWVHTGQPWAAAVCAGSAAGVTEPEDGLVMHAMRRLTHALDGGEHVGALGVGLRIVAVGGDCVGKLGRCAGRAACSPQHHQSPPAANDPRDGLTRS